MFMDLYLYRIKNDLTQKELAKLAGLSKTTVQQIEGGKTIPRADTIAYLAHALNMSPGDLYINLIEGEDCAMKREAY